MIEERMNVVRGRDQRSSEAQIEADQPSTGQNGPTCDALVFSWVLYPYNIIDGTDPTLRDRPRRHFSGVSQSGLVPRNFP